MADMARFIKPILSVVPPDPGRINPMEWLPLTGLAKTFRDLPERLQTDVHPAHDDERGRLPRPVVRDGATQGDDERLRHHRHLPGSALAGHGVRPAAPLHGRDRRRLPRLGHPEGRHRRRQPTRSRRRRCPSASRSAPSVRWRGSTRRAAVPPAWSWRPARRSRPGYVLSSLDSNLTFLKLLEGGTLDPEFEAEVRRYKYRGLQREGEPGAGRAPGARVQAGCRGVAPRRDQLQPRRSTTWSRPTTTRSTAGPAGARTST